VVAQLRTERLGEGGECDVPVPADVASTFEMIQSEPVFELPVVVLDTPTDFREPDEVSQWGLDR